MSPRPLASTLFYEKTSMCLSMTANIASMCQRKVSGHSDSTHCELLINFVLVLVVVVVVIVYTCICMTYLFV